MMSHYDPSYGCSDYYDPFFPSPPYAHFPLSPSYTACSTSPSYDSFSDSSQPRWVPPLPMALISDFHQPRMSNMDMTQDFSSPRSQDRLMTFEQEQRLQPDNYQLSGYAPRTLSPMPISRMHNFDCQVAGYMNRSAALCDRISGRLGEIVNRIDDGTHSRNIGTSRDDQYRKPSKLTMVQQTLTPLLIPGSWIQHYLKDLSELVESTV